MTQPILPDTSSLGLAEPAMEARTVAKILWRLLPLIVALYICNYLDRVNVSFAKLTMNADLRFSDEVYGLGAGIFFVAYFLFEVPSNLIMQRVGARRWLARIMISWGLVSSAMVFIHSPWSFYVLRFLLGVAEAGFAPGILLYLTYWLPLRAQGRAVAWFLTSIALAGVLGSPLAGLLLKLDGIPFIYWPLHGWQWLFLLEGLPSVIGGCVVLALLPDGPAQARWLSDNEKSWLAQRLQDEHASRQTQGHTSLWAGLFSGQVLMLSLIYGLLMFAFQGLLYWMPTLIKQGTGLKDDLQISLLTILPYASAALAMVLVGRHSDRHGERRWHVVTCCLLGAAALTACTFTTSPLLILVSLCLAAAAVFSTLGPFWAIPPGFLVGTAAAAGLALINSAGNLGGGFLGPYLMGVAKDRSPTHSSAVGLWLDAAALAIAALLVARLHTLKAPSPHPELLA